MNRRSWTRLALRRASRRQQTEIPPPQPAAGDAPLPPLEPPNDDREFVPWPQPPSQAMRLATT